MSGVAYDAEISISPIAADASVQSIGFREALAGIKSGRWAVPVEIVRTAHAQNGKAASDKPKKNLPGLTFSGKFSYRSADKIIAHSGLICADIDKLGDQVSAYKEHFAADPHVIAVFVSPTGTGLKAIFRCDPERPHKESFESLEHYVIEHFGVTPDEKCKDCSRLCFVSHDPEMAEHENAEVIPYLPPKPKAVPRETTHSAVSSANGEIKPGEDYNLRGGSEIPALLRKHGWTHYRGPYWCRPGKEDAISASLGIVAENVFHPFSNDPATKLPKGVEGFDPFELFTQLEHGGDHHASASALYHLGYGTRHKSRQEQNLEKIAGPATEGNGHVEHDAPFGQGADEEGVKPASVQAVSIAKRGEWPAPVTAEALCITPPPTPPVLIEDILYRGGTMLVSGPSKSHKTYTMLDLAIAIADGKPWLNFKSAKSGVLYVNLELQGFAVAKRVAQICSATGGNPPPNLHMWNLRGHRVTLDALALVLPEIIKSLDIGLVIIDPHYKISSVSGKEENSNDDQGVLLSALEGLCGQNGAALGITHHFAKGDASVKTAIDRASGGGVFARWGDVMLTFTPHEEDDAMTVEMALRNFAPVAPFVVRWNHPRWSRDDELDPTKLKTRGGGPKERYSADETLKVLTSPMTHGDWMKASGLKDSTFKRKRDQLIEDGKVVLSMGLYRKVE